MKQPMTISINMLTSTNDPHKILLANPDRKLTKYQDCVEAVRYTGTLKLDSLSVLEVDYDIGLTEEFLYHLKLQLIIIGAKLVYYQMRSDTLYDMFKDSERSVKKLIEVINAYFLLEIILKKNVLSSRCKTSMCGLRNYLNSYLNETITKEPFQTAQTTIRNDLTSMLEKCKTVQFEPEKCFYCQENIESEQLNCPQNHQFHRCIITKLQVPITSRNYCQNCNCCVVDLETLKEITGKDENLCMFCDRYFTFS